MTGSVVVGATPAVEGGGLWGMVVKGAGFMVMDEWRIKINIYS